MSDTIIEISGFAIKWYSVLIMIGVVLGIILATKEAKRFDIPSDFVFNLCFWTLIVGFIGARLYFVLFNFSSYQDNLLEILMVWKGGLAIHGGILFGGLTALIYCKKYKANFLRMTDIMAVSLLLAQAIGRWGNFFNKEAYGPATSLANLHSNFLIPNFVADGMLIDGVYYEPMFYYESLWCLLGFIILFILRRFKYVKIGQVTCLYAMWYSVARFFIEAGRMDALEFGGFRVAQIVSIALFVIALFAFMVISRKGRFEANYNEKDSIEIRF